MPGKELRKRWGRVPPSPPEMKELVTCLNSVAEREGFEPPVPQCGTAVFETAPFGRSGTSPHRTCRCREDPPMNAAHDATRIKAGGLWQLHSDIGARSKPLRRGLILRRLVLRAPSTPREGPHSEPLRPGNGLRAPFSGTSLRRRSGLRGPPPGPHSTALAQRRGVAGRHHPR